ncbi:MAG: hypothetical protein LBU21_05715, partial [Treponema sp.]|nr:hypothetical protein [Treponema sp.]
SIFIQNWPTWDFDFNADSSPSYSQAVKDAAMALHREANTTSANINAIWNQLASIAITEEKNLFEVQGLPVEASLNEIVMGTGDVTAMYRAFIAEQNNRGLQRVIESVNAAIK